MIKLSNPINLEEIKSYAEFLYKNLSRAIIPPFKSVTIYGKTPKVRECHINAQNFVAENPDYSIVYGWLCRDASNPYQFLFLAHSLVKDRDGNLLEITPMQTFEPIPFLESQISDDDYEVLHDWLLEISNDTTLAHTHTPNKI